MLNLKLRRPVQGVPQDYPACPVPGTGHPAARAQPWQPSMQSAPGAARRDKAAASAAPAPGRGRRAAPPQHASAAAGAGRAQYPLSPARPQQAAGPAHHAIATAAAGHVQHPGGGDSAHSGRAGLGEAQTAGQMPWAPPAQRLSLRERVQQLQQEGDPLKHKVARTGHNH